MDEKITLIDTVKREFVDGMLDTLSQIVDPKKIDHVISNHTEMDHSGGLPRVMHRIGEDKTIYCSKMGYKNLIGHLWIIPAVCRGSCTGLERTRRSTARKWAIRILSDTLVGI
ncbi:MAG: hypothetical protein JRF41_11805 [Deltaproteobacteria bacterium]|nr:hypothetical protein [Deltaproteobacteria bacterium]